MLEYSKTKTKTIRDTYSFSRDPYPISLTGNKNKLMFFFIVILSKPMNFNNGLTIFSPLVYFYTTHAIVSLVFLYSNNNNNNNNNNKNNMYVRRSVVITLYTIRRFVTINMHTYTYIPSTYLV